MYNMKTYIAGDWDNDKEAIDKLYEWKEKNYLSFDFYDIHEDHQSNDDSYYCSIKESLRLRLHISDVFVLIVGDKTTSITKGKCSLCSRYSESGRECVNGHYFDKRSFIEFECELAYKLGLEILVLYNALVVDKDKCPECLRNVGSHITMKKFIFFNFEWDYEKIRQAFKLIEYKKLLKTQ